MILEKTYHLKFHHYNENSILVNWPNKISTNILADIIRFKALIVKSNLPIEQLNNAYASLLIQYKERIDNIQVEIDLLEKLYPKGEKTIQTTKKNWKIPVCYEGNFALDIEEMSIALGLTSKEIIERHTAPIYTVYFVGFLPGFLYLGGLDSALYFPRKSNPRLKVPAGSVSIGNHQTGVYPNESPGGWNIIGNSPISFFNTKRKQPCFAKAGDEIQFYPVSKNTYDDISVLVQNDLFHLEFIND